MYLLYFSKHQAIVELQEDLRQQVEDHLEVSILFICALFLSTSWCWIFFLVEDQDTGLPARLQTAGGDYEEGSSRGVWFIIFQRPENIEM